MRADHCLSTSNVSDDSTDERGEDGDMQRDESNDFAQMAEALGVTENRCIKDATNRVREHYDNMDTQFAAGAVTWGGLGYMAGRNTYTKGGSSIDGIMSEQGCGTLIGHMNDTLIAMNNIRCTINNNIQKDTANVSSGASIRIGMTASESELATQGRINSDLILATLDTIKTLCKTKTKNGVLVPESLTCRRLADNANKMIDANEDFGRNTFTNSSLTASSDVKVKKIMKGNFKSDLDFNNQTTALATSMAETQVEATLGVGALTPDVKQLIQQRVEQQLNDVQESINNTELVSDINIQGDGSILINSKFGSDFDGSNLKATSEVDLTMTQIMDSYAKLASKVVNDITADSQSTSTSDTKSAGLEDIMKQIASMREAQIAGFMENLPELANPMGGILGMGITAFLLPLILVGVGLYVVKKFFKGGMGGGKGGGGGGGQGGGMGSSNCTNTAVVLHCVTGFLISCMAGAAVVMLLVDKDWMLTPNITVYKDEKEKKDKEDEKRLEICEYNQSHVREWGTLSYVSLGMGIGSVIAVILWTVAYIVYPKVKGRSTNCWTVLPFSVGFFTGLGVPLLVVHTSFQTVTYPKEECPVIEREGE